MGGLRQGVLVFAAQSQCRDIRGLVEQFLQIEFGNNQARGNQSYAMAQFRGQKPPVQAGDDQARGGGVQLDLDILASVA